MKTNYIYSILLFSGILVICSCGPNAQEVAAKEKLKMDSIAKVTEENTRIKVERERAIADSIAAAEASKMENEANQELEKANLKQTISDDITELRLAKEKLARIKEFTLGRTAAEKEQQITQQYKVIQSWEDEISRLEDELKKY